MMFRFCRIMFALFFWIHTVRSLLTHTGGFCRSLQIMMAPARITPAKKKSRNIIKENRHKLKETNIN